MQAHQLLQQDPLRQAGRKRARLPVYDVEPGVSKFVLSDDAASVYKVVGGDEGHVIVPLVERDGHALPDLAMAMIEAVLMERAGPSLGADTVHDAILLGAAALEDLDLKLGAVLVRTGTQLSVPAFGATVVCHDDVEPGLVICLPEPEFLGIMPVLDEASFGMMIHNPAAVVPVRT